MADSAQHGAGVSAPSSRSKGPGPADQDPLQISGNHSRPLPTEGEGKQHCFSSAEVVLEHHQRNLTFIDQTFFYPHHTLVKSFHRILLCYCIKLSFLHAFMRLNVPTVVQCCCVFSGQLCEGGNNESSQSCPHLL